MATRRDYIATAKILQQFRKDIPVEVFLDLTHEFAEMYFADNKNFNFDIFYSACDGEE